VDLPAPIPPVSPNLSNSPPRPAKRREKRNHAARHWDICCVASSLGE
jgi:hypothetical protein